MKSESFPIVESPEGSNPSLTALSKARRSNKVPTKERFWRQVDRSQKDACWPWLGYRDKDGYGRITLGKRKVQAHRFAYFLKTGEEPGSLCVRHSCDNPRCVNPAHLATGTHRDNMRDRNIRRRSARGERNGRSKLTPVDVREIPLWRKLGASFRSIARRFDIDESVVRDICAGRTWNHVTGLREAA